ncbi:MAG: DivIVA domain-containing protein [Nocardioidaceae bacterium]|nr:DivIVA domain-containing protein [Nocardioidaceae bacterium]
MTWVWIVVIVLVIGGLSVVLVGRGESMAEVYDDRPDSTIPTGRPLTADDVRDVRFSTALRGYRMDEVDALLSRLQADLLARDDYGEAQRAEGASDPAVPSGFEKPAASSAYEEPDASSASEKPDDPDLRPTTT